ncbi:hypothetical protein ACJJIG_10900 [Microbulbifer sp. SSSA007]|uniref:hypothetical protein n=1 Tax=Microbulbifer sp. SSSA007 TaxID=3243379 RepID=UPI0040397A2B
MLTQLDANTLLFALMDQLLAMSNDHVDQIFSYAGFRRFSRTVDLNKIARMSVILRQQGHLNSDQEFLQAFERANEATDRTRIPRLHPGPLAERRFRELNEFAPLQGILPK